MGMAVDDNVNWQALIDCSTVMLFIGLVYYLVGCLLKLRYPCTADASSTADARRLQQLRRELQAISPVAEFARHARKKREVDALSAAIQKRENATNKMKLCLYFNVLRYILLAVTMFCISVVFYGVPLLYVDDQVLYPANWLLSIPGCKTPEGSNKVPVSIHCVLVVSSAAISALTARWEQKAT